MTDTTPQILAEARLREILCDALEISEPWRAEILEDGNAIYELSPSMAIEAMLATERAAIERCAAIARSKRNMQCGPFTSEVCDAIATAIMGLIPAEGGAK